MIFPCIIIFYLSMIRGIKHSCFNLIITSSVIERDSCLLKLAYLVFVLFPVLAINILVGSYRFLLPNKTILETR